MKPFMTVVPLSLIFSSTAFGQAGAEGDASLLYPTTLAAAAPAAPVAAPAAKLAAPARAISQVALASVPTAAPVVASPALTQGPRMQLAKPGKGNIADYDFGEVVQALRNSVQPLAGEIGNGFPRFVGQIDDAIALMEQGRNTEAVALSAQAIDGVLASRDAVVNPLWEAQFYLNEQIAVVRSKLAQSLTTNDPTTDAGKATAQSAQMLDQIATRISQTKDPVRKRQLVAHYRTMRTLTKVRANSLHMSPDQRKLWFGVLRVLEQASVAHQQVLMGSETLFAQLDGTGSQLRDYLGLMQTMAGVDSLLGSVQGGGMQGFVEGMKTLQDQMESFSESMQGALESSMVDLETRVDSIQSTSSDDEGGLLTPTSIDDELKSRIDRISPSGAN
jgi:hypothetical protein